MAHASTAILCDRVGRGVGEAGTADIGVVQTLGACLAGGHLGAGASTPVRLRGRSIRRNSAAPHLGPCAANSRLSGESRRGTDTGSRWDLSQPNSTARVGPGGQSLETHARVGLGVRWRLGSEPRSGCQNPAPRCPSCP